MDIPSIQSQVKASVLPFDQLASNPNVPQDEKVKEACRQFEAIFLRQILGDARKTVIHSPVNEDSNTSAIYSDMINNQLADSISKSGAFGLAKSLQSQLVHQVLPKTAATAKAAVSAPLATPLKKTLNSP